MNIEKLNEMTVPQLNQELNDYTGASIKKRKATKAELIEELTEIMIEVGDLEVDEVEGEVYITKTEKRNGDTEWRIMLTEGGNTRWLNMKAEKADAVTAAERTAAKRGVPFTGKK